MFMTIPKNNSEHKLCLKCNTIKSKTDFYVNKKNVISAHCKCCVKGAVNKYRKNNPDKIKFSKEQYKERRKIVRKDSERKYYLKNKYNLLEGDYKLMYDNQNGGCKLCDKKVEYKKLHIDHCHTSNKIRGLLCSNCNLGLGNFKDNIETLLRAVDYLKS